MDIDINKTRWNTGTHYYPIRCGASIWCIHTITRSYSPHSRNRWAVSGMRSRRNSRRGRGRGSGRRRWLLLLKEKKIKGTNMS